MFWRPRRDRLEALYLIRIRPVNTPHHLRALFLPPQLKLVAAQPVAWCHNVVAAIGLSAIKTFAFAEFSCFWYFVRAIYTWPNNRGEGHLHIRAFQCFGNLLSVPGHHVIQCYVLCINLEVKKTKGRKIPIQNLLRYARSLHSVHMYSRTIPCVSWPTLVSGSARASFPRLRWARRTLLPACGGTCGTT